MAGWGDYDPWMICTYCGGPLGRYGCANCRDLEREDDEQDGADEPALPGARQGKHCARRR